MASPDNLLISALHGTAWRAAVERRSLDGSIEELRRIAGGRLCTARPGGRRPVRGPRRPAGVTAGFWLAGPDRHIGHELVTAGMLIMAAEGLDYDRLAHWVGVGWQRGSDAHRPIHGFSTAVRSPSDERDPRS